MTENLHRRSAQRQFLTSLFILYEEDSVCSPIVSIATILKHCTTLWVPDSGSCIGGLPCSLERMAEKLKGIFFFIFKRKELRTVYTSLPQAGALPMQLLLELPPDTVPSGHDSGLLVQPI
uniref:Uncharacterized protein n=1 Tax=Micrurus corallinus TaxID=54390 RepID=A0A2D4GH50_MICCO